MATTDQGGGDNLTARQKRFAEEYAATGNGVQSYFAAYGRTYVGKSGETVPRSYRAVQVSASRLLSDPILRAEVEAARRAQARRARCTRDRWVQQLTAVAFAYPDDLYEADPATGLPRPRPWADLPPVAKRSLQGVKVRPGRSKGEAAEVEYRPADKLKAMELLGKHFGYFDPKPLDHLLALLPPPAAHVIRRALAEATASHAAS